MTKKQLGMLIRCCICVGCSIGLISNCIGIFYTPISEGLKTGRGQIAVISTIISLSSAFAGQIVARLIKKVPIQYVMTTGVIMTCTGLFLISFSRKLPILYILAALIGIGDICFKNLTVSIVLRSWFGNKSASKLGIAMAMTGIVAAVMNPVLSGIISASGYETGFRVLALIIAALCVPAALTIRLGDAVDLAPKAAGTNAKEVPKTVIPAIVMAMLFVMPILISGSTGMNTHFSSYAVTMGYTLNFGATVVAVQSVFNSVWKLVYGFLADKLGVMKVCLAYLALTIISCVILILFRGVPAMIIMGVVIFPMAFSVSTVAMPTMIQVVAKERYPEIFATSNMIQTIGYALFTSFYGIISDKAGGYIPCLVMVIFFSLMCSITCIIVSKREHLR